MIVIGITSFISIIILLVITYGKKITTAIWSIKVFRSHTFLSSAPQREKLDQPTLCAADVTDVPAEFVADPFIVTDNEKFYMFFEVFDKSIARGIIGLAISVDGEKWEYQRIVLKETFHLSYPHVFQWQGEWYMIPETIGAEKIVLYKAKRFPYDWEVSSKLVNGKYVDPSIFQYENNWWMFAGSEGKLHLFFSDTLEGNWKEHPQSPLLENNYSVSRPGGRVIVENDQIYRYTQDGTPYYGSSVRVFKINKLSETEYLEEQLDQILIGSQKEVDWRKDGMHSIDQLKMKNDQWLIAVDGHTFEKRNQILAKIDYIMARVFS